MLWGMAAQVQTVLVPDAAALRAMMDSYLAQGYLVGTRAPVSATMTKRKEFSLPFSSMRRSQSSSLAALNLVMVLMVGMGYSVGFGCCVPSCDVGGGAPLGDRGRGYSKVLALFTGRLELVTDFNAPPSSCLGWPEAVVRKEVVRCPQGCCRRFRLVYR